MDSVVPGLYLLRVTGVRKVDLPMYGIIHARPYVVVSQHQIDTALRELQKMTEMIEQQRYDIARLRELLLLQRADDRDESTNDGKSSQPDT